MSESILTSVKKVLGITEDYTVFDVDVIMHINSAFATLNQLGIGPEGGFDIVDSTSVWEDFLGTDKRYNSVKSYVYLVVRKLFDPPATGYLVTALDETIKQYEWRLMTVKETLNPPTVSSEEDDEILSIDGGTP